MKNKGVRSMVILAAAQAPPGGVVTNGPMSYLIGGIVALLIMGYLVYTLMRPDKF
jgi:K+-transporting ATPase KdpF subunit